MGLLYPLPTSLEEEDFVLKKPGESLLLKSYGLPYIFWLYSAGILVCVLGLGLGVYAPLQKLASSEELLDQLLTTLVWATLLSVPCLLFCFHFYEKQILLTKNHLRISHRLAGITLRSTDVIFSPLHLYIEHVSDTPNIAKTLQKEELRGFQNGGYFSLFYKSDEKILMVDRSNKKKDLLDLQALLTDWNSSLGA